MQPHPLAGQQVVVDRLGEQRVAERVARAGRLEHLLLDRGAQRVVELVGLHLGHGGEQPVGDPAAGDRRGADHAPGCPVETVQPHQQQVGEVDREILVTAGLHQLLDEEGIALGAAYDTLGVDLAGGELVDQQSHGVVGQRLEHHPLHVGQPAPLAHLAAQRVAAVDVVGAVGGDHRDRAVVGAGEEVGQQVAGGLVGPVGVLDHDQQRRLLGGRLEEGVDGVEELSSIGAGRGGPLVGAHHAAYGPQPGQRRIVGGHPLDDVGQVRDDPVEDLRERHVRHGALAEVDAVSRVHLPAVGHRPVTEGGEQARLPDAGVAGEEDVLPPGIGDRVGRGDSEQPGQGLQLGVATYEGPSTLRHAPYHRAFRPGILPH